MPITKERHHALAQAGKAWLEYSLVLRTALRSIHHAILSNESFTREQISGSIADLFSNFTLPDHEHAMTIERELALHQATRAKNERAKAAMRRYRLRVGAPTRAQAEPELNAQLIVDKALAKYKALQAADLETGLPLEPPRSPTPEVIPLDPAEAWAFGQGSADKEEDQDWLIDLELPEEAPSAQPRADENIE